MLNTAWVLYHESEAEMQDVLTLRDVMMVPGQVDNLGQ